MIFTDMTVHASLNEKLSPYEQSCLQNINIASLHEGNNSLATGTINLYWQKCLVRSLTNKVKHTDIR